LKSNYAVQNPNIPRKKSPHFVDKHVGGDIIALWSYCSRQLLWKGKPMRMKLLVVTVLALGMIPFGCQPKQEQVVMPETKAFSAEPQPISTGTGSTTDKPPLVAPDTTKKPAKVTPLTPPAATDGKTYTVKKGDTFFSISREIYGSDRRAKDIQAANPSVDPSKMAIGTTLNLPPK